MSPATPVTSAATRSTDRQPSPATKTFCRICVAFCGLDVHSADGKIDKVLPDRTHPYNWRDYCSKGGTANVVRDHPKRLTVPMKRVGDRYVEASWDEAIGDIAARLSKIRDAHGPHAIATYLGNPGALNSPGALFQGGFMKGLGSDNNYYVGSVDQNNAHVVAEAMYGSELGVLVPDVDHAKCFLFLGMNPAVSMMAWLDTVPQGWERVLASQAAGADMIVVDPRETPTTKKANLHVKIRPGSDWAFLLGVIKVVFEQNWEHRADCDAANGVDTLRALAAAQPLAELSARCEVPEAQIREVARRFATAETAVCVARTGVSQNRNGTLGEWLSHALNLITGRIDRKGGRYHQPGIFKNTMKVYNLMAPPVKRRSRIGNYRAVAGAYPLAILPEEITTPGQDQIRALIINAGNPVVSGPHPDKLDAALQQLELLVAIDMFQRESHRHAHWLIPGTHFLEREEFFAVFFGVLFERGFAQFGAATIEPRGGVRSEWEFFCDLALKMKVPFMGIPGLNAVIRTSRWIARRTGNPRHAFNPRWFWALMVKAFSEIRWKDLLEQPQGLFVRDKEYGHLQRCLMTPDRRIHAAPPSFVAVLRARLGEPLDTELTASFPLRLVNQRRSSMMNSWLVESSKHRRDYGELIEINPQDAAARGIVEQQQVAVRSATGRIELRARLTEDVPAGIVSIDHGWGSRLFDPQHGAPPEVRGVMRNQLISTAQIDELAGTPNLNGTSVEVTALTGAAVASLTAAAA